jgi:hypothetical protein
MYDESGAVGAMRTGKGKIITCIKHTPLPHCKSQILYDLS